MDKKIEFPLYYELQDIVADKNKQPGEYFERDVFLACFRGLPDTHMKTLSRLIVYHYINDSKNKATATKGSTVSAPYRMKAMHGGRGQYCNADYFPPELRDILYAYIINQTIN